MKKVLFLLLMFVLTAQTSNAQLYDIYIPSDIVLTDHQWHMDGYCIVEANNNMYLVISPDGYRYYPLEPLNLQAFAEVTRDVLLSYRPYFRNNNIGWLVEGRRAFYFTDAYFNYVILTSYPVYYDYYYRFNRITYLNMRNYYWHRLHGYRPRPLPPRGPRYGNGHMRPPKRERPPHNNGMGNRPPQRQDTPNRPPQRGSVQNRPPQGQGYQSRPSQGSATQSRPPQRSSGSATQSRPPQQRSNGSATQSRPPQQRSNGSATQSRPPQRSNGSNHSSGRSNGSSSRRR